nr:unnamed protein product [Spirometra erinaceieuropaei]
MKKTKATRLLVVLSVVYVSWNPTVIFHWHPILMTFGVFVPILQGVIIYNSDSSLLPSSHPKKKFAFHWCLEAVGLLLITCGFLIAVYVKTELSVTALDPAPLPHWRRRRGGLFKTCLDTVRQDMEVVLGPSVFGLRRWRGEWVELSRSAAADRHERRGTVRDIIEAG